MENLYFFALIYLLIHAMEHIDKAQHYRKTQWVLLGLSALAMLHTILVFITR